eukprot:548468_1
MHKQTRKVQPKHAFCRYYDCNHGRCCPGHTKRNQFTLTRWTNHPLRSAFIQFLVGGTVLCPLFILCKPKPYADHSLRDTFNNLFHALKKDKKNYFVFANGSCGIVWVCTAIYVAPQIGFGLYALCIVIGQIVSSMVIDHFGLVWSVQKKLSLLNLFGSLIAIGGVVIFQLPQIMNSDHTIDLLLFVYMLISIFAGTCFTLLSAFNTRLKALMNSTPYQPAFLLFVNAVALLLMINVVIYIILDDWFEVNHGQLDWYIFFGGVMAAFVVVIYIICLSHIGFVTTYICSIFGSLVISLIYDIVGAFGVDVAQNVSALKFIGVICVLCGAIVMNINRHSVPSDQESMVQSTTELRELVCIEDTEIRQTPKDNGV